MLARLLLHLGCYPAPIANLMFSLRTTQTILNMVMIGKAQSSTHLRLLGHLRTSSGTVIVVLAPAADRVNVQVPE